MKQITLKSAKILETTFTEKSISILYQVLDDAGGVIINNRITINRTDLPTAGQTALTTLEDRLLQKIVTREGL